MADQNPLIRKADIPALVMWFVLALLLGKQVAEGGRFWTALVIAFVIVGWARVSYEQGRTEGLKEAERRGYDSARPTKFNQPL